MFMDVIKSHYKENTPIFRKEIISLFPQYSQIYVCKMIKEAVDSGELAHHSMGIYYIPTMTKYGISHLAPDDIIIKKYIKDLDRQFGIFSGLTLENIFSFTSQVPATIQVVSNKESSKRRKVNVGKAKFIVSKSRVEITNENAATYTILELFSSLKDDELDEDGLEVVNSYIKENDISKESLISLGEYFPKRTMKKLYDKGII